MQVVRPMVFLLIIRLNIPGSCRSLRIIMLPLQCRTMARTTTTMWIARAPAASKKGTADKHLTFYVSLFCSDLDNKKQAISISTIVKYKNILGRIYFAAIWIFHWIIVHNLFRRAVKKWLSRDNITTTKD